MARTKLRQVVDAESGMSFYFGYDRQDPTRLHVDVRGQTVQAAIDAYFSAALAVWNGEHRRWESQNETTGIYWAHLNNRPGHILIISCFSLEK